MILFKQKLIYFLSSLKKYVLHVGFSCPSCNHSDFIRVDRKYIVTALNRCKHCQLLFRTPTTDTEENASFYQENYIQGFTTALPTDEQLNIHLKNNFSNTEKDYSTYVEILQKALPGNSKKIFDLGCSWGYGSWQLKRSGFEVESFEISSIRADYARKKLDIKVHSSISDVSGKFDCFFSCHVLEHLPSVRDAISFGFRILKPGGLFVAITPNGSEPRRKLEPKLWHQQWGVVHPNMLDDNYYISTFADRPYFLSAPPYSMDNIENWKNTECQRIYHLDGPELLFITRK